MKQNGYDLVVVGAGVIGLSAALAGLRRQWRVLVVERHEAAVGASIRNFGFVTVTGQKRGGHWRRAMRTRDIWLELAAQADIKIEHQGLTLVAKRLLAGEVLHEFAQTEMGQGCTFLTKAQAQDKLPGLDRRTSFSEFLYSPHELRIESAKAVGQFALWLEQQGVAFSFSTSAFDLTAHGIETSRGPVSADRIVVCPGDNYAGPLADIYQDVGLSHCTLQMLRVEPGLPDAIDCGLMSDLSLVRYEGYADLPASKALLAQLQQEKSEQLRRGIHLIAVRSADGSLVVGDSHQDGQTPIPFSDELTDDLIMSELRESLDLPNARVISRWTGSYARLADHIYHVSRPQPHVRSLIVTGGTGASTGLALGEDVLADLEGEIVMDDKGTES